MIVLAFFIIGGVVGLLGDYAGLWGKGKTDREERRR